MVRGIVFGIGSVCQTAVSLLRLISFLFNNKLFTVFERFLAASGQKPDMITAHFATVGDTKACFHQPLELILQLGITLILHKTEMTLLDNVFIV